MLLLNNLPAVEEGNHVLRELAALYQTIGNRFEMVDQQLGGVTSTLNIK